MHSGQNAKLSQTNRFVQQFHLPFATHKPDIGGRQVTGGIGNAAHPLYPFAQRFFKFFEPVFNIGLFQRIGPIVVPRAEIETLPAAYLFKPCFGFVLKAGFVKSRNFHKIDLCHPIALCGAGILVFEVFHDLPFAIVAFEIIWRKDKQQQMGIFQPFHQPLFPVFHPFDLVLVEETFEFFFGKFKVFGFNFFFEFGNPVGEVVFPGVADKEVVLHGVWIF